MESMKQHSTKMKQYEEIIHKDSSVERVDKTQSGVKVYPHVKEAMRVEISHEKNPIESMENTDYRKQKVDTGTYAKARDQSTEPMVGEKSTDPKMRDQETGAWKRDTRVQTSIKSVQRAKSLPKSCKLSPKRDLEKSLEKTSGAKDEKNRN